MKNNNIIKAAGNWIVFFVLFVGACGFCFFAALVGGG